MPTITVPAAKVLTMLEDGGEIAFIDVREVAQFGTGHPLTAAPLPLGQIEQRIAALVPRLDTRLIVTDGGEGRSDIAASRLSRLGYTNVSVLEGGAPAWTAAGFALFPELDVTAKGFGGFVTHHAGPRFIRPIELRSAIADGEDWVLLDCRTRKEYQAGNIPGSINAPAGQLLRCFDDLVHRPTTKVAVNCMSRTRGILGGVSLAAAGVPNRVFTLWNGTRAWLLEGYELEHGASRFASAPSPQALLRARERAAALAERAGIPSIDLGTLAKWRNDTSQTTYVFDVRDGEEYAAGHLPGARSAPEGSLVMHPDHYIGTLNARCVLVDDDGVRAAIEAIWLSQMGLCNPYILDDEDLPRKLTETGIEPRNILLPDRFPVSTISSQALESSIRRGRRLIIDVGDSQEYIRRHIPGAGWCLRSSLAEVLDSMTNTGSSPVLTSEDGVMAMLAAGDLAESGRHEVTVLEGGNSAWCASGFPFASGPTSMLSPRDDRWIASSERPGDQRANVLAYLAWEESLYADIEHAGSVPYRNMLWR